MDERYKKAGLTLADIERLRAVLHKKKEDKKKKQEYLESLVAQDKKDQLVQEQKVIAAAKVKLMEQSGSCMEFRSRVLATHIEKENMKLLKLKQEEKESEKITFEEYKGGMLPQNKAVLKFKQERDEEKQRLLQSVIKFNTEEIKMKSLEKGQKATRPPHDEDNEEDVKKQQSKKALFQSLTECVALKNTRLEKEQKMNYKMEEERQRVEFERDTKLKQRELERKEKFRNLQIPSEIAVNKLAKLKQKDAIIAQRQEEQQNEQIRTIQDLQLKKETEMKARNAASLKDLEKHWEVQMQDRTELKKLERQKQFDWLQEQRENERLLLEKEKQKARERRQTYHQFDEVNSRMLNDKHLLSERRRSQEREARMKALQTSEKDSQFKNYIEQEIHKAVADNRRVVPLLRDKKSQLESDDRLYVCTKNSCVVWPRKSTNETRRSKAFLERNKLELSYVENSDLEKTQGASVCNSSLNKHKSEEAITEETVPQKEFAQNGAFFKETFVKCPSVKAERSSCGPQTVEAVKTDGKLLNNRASISFNSLKRTPTAAGVPSPGAPKSHYAPGVLDNLLSRSATAETVSSHQHPKANRVVLTKDLDTKQNPVFPPPIGPKRTPTGVQTFSVEDKFNKASAAQAVSVTNKTKDLKMPLIQPNLTSVGGRHPPNIRAYRSGLAPKVSDIPLRFVAANAPSIKQQLYPKRIDFHRRPSILPIIPNRTTANGPMLAFKNNNFVQGIGLIPVTKKT